MFRRRNSIKMNLIEETPGNHTNVKFVNWRCI